ncbi:MAG: hypothetical protein R3Y60_04135 [bacterium]
MNNKLKDLLEQYFNNKVTNINKVTANVTLFCIEDQKYITKLVSSKCNEIYNFLLQQQISTVSYPLKKFRINEGLFFLYKYETELNIPVLKKTQQLLDSITVVHKGTSYEKKLNKKNYKYLFRTYKKTDYKFQMLEMYIREAEVKQSKNDFDWVILSKYSIFLDTKIIMYNLQKKIHNYIDEKISVVYALNHGNLDLNHLYNKKIISFDNAYRGIFISDLARLYVECDHINLDWHTVISQIIDPYENNFYKIYFKFLVLYIYVINIDFDLVDINNACNKYIQLSRRISNFLTHFSDYK